MKSAEESLRDRTAVLQYLKSRYPMFHESNFFFRDLQYGIQEYLGERGMPVDYGEADHLARGFASALEQEGLFVPVDGQTWTLNYPAFKKPVVKAPEPAPRPAGTAAPKPAAPAPPKPPVPAAAQPAPDEAARQR